MCWRKLFKWRSRPTFRGCGVASSPRSPETRRRVYMSQHGHRLRPQPTAVCTLHSAAGQPSRPAPEGPRPGAAPGELQQTGATRLVDDRRSALLWVHKPEEPRGGGGRNCSVRNNSGAAQWEGIPSSSRPADAAASDLKVTPAAFSARWNLDGNVFNKENSSEEAAFKSTSERK